MSDETKHSPEPWYVEAGRDIESETGRTIVWGHDDFNEPTMSEADCRRIVACVNALAGIPTEALEAGALAYALDAAKTVGARWSMNGLGSGDEAALENLVTALRSIKVLP